MRVITNIDFIFIFNGGFYYYLKSGNNKFIDIFIFMYPTQNKYFISYDM